MDQYNFYRRGKYLVFCGGELSKFVKNYFETAKRDHREIYLWIFDEIIIVNDKYQFPVLLQNEEETVESCFVKAVSLKNEIGDLEVLTVEGAVVPVTNVEQMTGYWKAEKNRLETEKLIKYLEETSEKTKRETGGPRFEDEGQQEE